MKAPPTRGGARSGSGRVRRPDDERWRLTDRRDFLRRSLADAEAEHAAGDLSDDDYAALRSRDRARLAEVEASLAELAPDTGDAGGAGASVPARGAKEGAKEGRSGARTPPAARRAGRPVRRRSRRRNLLAVVGLLAIAAGVVLLVVQLSSQRLPGQASSGSVNLTPAQQVRRELAQAADLVNRGQLAEALALYQQVLAEAPNQPEALAERGWIEYEAGVETHEPALVEKGRASVERALAVQPEGYAAHLYLGTIELQQDRDPAAAVGQYRLFLAEGPPQRLIDQSAVFLRQAFTEDGQPVPADVPATSGTSGTSGPSGSPSPRG